LLPLPPQAESKTNNETATNDFLLIMNPDSPINAFCGGFIDLPAL
jgi:hypothetical protein